MKRATYSRFLFPGTNSPPKGPQTDEASDSSCFCHTGPDKGLALPESSHTGSKMIARHSPFDDSIEIGTEQ